MIHICVVTVDTHAFIAVDELGLHAGVLNS